MNQKQLEYLLAIDEFKTITKAADHLFITRSALNYSLLNLEYKLGIPLFKRINNQLIPTTAGSIYINYAKQILLLMKECDSAMHDLKDQNHGHLNVGITPGYGQKVFTDVYPEFYKKFPSYNIQLYEGNAKQLYKSLHDGKIDFAWCAYHRHEQNLNHIVLETNPVYLAVPESRCRQPFDSHKNIQTVFADLKLYQSEQFILMNENSLIREISNLYFSEAGITNPKCIMECSLINMTRHFSSKGIAISFLPEPMCLPDLGIIYFPLPKTENFSLSISYRKETFLTNADKYFIDLIKQRYQTIVKH